MQSLRPLLFLICSIISGEQSFAQQIDTTVILQQADSLLQMYNMKIPEKYIDEVRLNHVTPRKAEHLYFKSPDFKLDTINHDNYQIYYSYRIGGFGYQSFDMILSKDKKTGSIEGFFSETESHFLRGIKDKNKTFDLLTKEKVMEMMEANGEIRLDSIQDPTGDLLYGWDTLAKNTYFTIAFKVVSMGNEEEAVSERQLDALIPITEVLSCPLKTPIIIIESSDPILCYVKKGGYGLARKHRMYFNLNTLFLMYDGFPSFRFIVGCGGL